MKEGKAAIISDIHGNLPALEAVLKDIDEKGITEIYCAGDIVGYGARPNECVETVKSRGIKCVRGNHDHDAVAENEDFLKVYSALAGHTMVWTRKILKQRNKDFLQELSYVIDTPLFHLVHGDLRIPRDFFDGYIHSAYHARCIFPSMQKQFCFIGHTHIAEVFYEDGEDVKIKIPFDNNDGKFVFGARTIVNAGSVGQPRLKGDRAKDPRAGYVVFTPPNSIEFVKVEYDIKLAQDQIKDAGLPISLALILEQKTI